MVFFLTIFSNIIYYFFQNSVIFNLYIYYTDFNLLYLCKHNKLKSVELYSIYFFLNEIELPNLGLLNNLSIYYIFTELFYNTYYLMLFNTSVFFVQYGLYLNSVVIVYLK